MRRNNNSKATTGTNGGGVAPTGSTILYQERMPSRKSGHGPKHHAAMVAAGNNGNLDVTSMMDPYHNDELPCCRSLQEIAQNILPPLPPTETSLSMNSSRNTHHDNRHNHNRGGSKPPPAGKKHLAEFSSSEGFIEMVQEFLWRRYWEQRQATERLPSEGALAQSSSNPKKKKKKKRKKKNKAAAADEEEAGGSNAEPEAAGKQQNSNSYREAKVGATYSDALVAEEKDADTSEPAEAETRRSCDARKEQAHLASDRDWWIHCYLERVVATGGPSATDENADNTSKGAKKVPKISDFLQVVSQKTTVNQSLKSKTPQSRKQHQQLESRSGSNGSDERLYFHISQKELQQVASRVECTTCRSRVTHFLSNCPRIPLLAWKDMPQKVGDGRRRTTMLEETIVQTGSGSDNNLSISGPNAEDFEGFPFDYHAMEEGNAVAGNEASEDGEEAVFCLQAVKSSQGETMGWRIQKNGQAAFPESLRDGLAKCSPPFSLLLTDDDFSFLLREFVLLPAIPYDTWVGTDLWFEHANASNNAQDDDEDDEAEEKMIQAVTNGVDERYSMVLHELTACMKELLDQQRTISSSSPPPSAENGDWESTDMMQNMSESSRRYDLKSPVRLFEIDAAICGVLRKLFRILMLVTNAYQEVMAHWHQFTTQNPHFSQANGTVRKFPSRLLAEQSSIDSLWEVYLGALATIISTIEGYEKELFPLADRHGTLKQFFSNAASRRLLSQVVQDKLKIVLGTMEALRKLLDDRKDTYETPVKDYTTTFLRSLLTQQQLLLQGIRGGCSTTTLPSSPTMLSNQMLKEELDVACEEVLHELSFSWIETKGKTWISQILESYSEKREKLERLLRVAHDGLKQRTPSSEGVLESLSSLLARTSKENATLEQALPVLRTDLVPAIKCMVQEWIFQSTHFALGGYVEIGFCETDTSAEGEVEVTPAPVVQPLIMPLNLIKWMSNERPNESRSHAQRCPGSDGALRATCLIMTLLYGWFVARYKEWQAESAEQELRAMMGDSSGGMSAAPDGAQPNKKKSKKKRGKQNSADGKVKHSGKAALPAGDDSNDSDIKAQATETNVNAKGDDPSTDEVEVQEADSVLQIGQQDDVTPPHLEGHGKEADFTVSPESALEQKATLESPSTVDTSKTMSTAASEVVESRSSHDAPDEVETDRSRCPKNELSDALELESTNAENGHVTREPRIEQVQERDPIGVFDGSSFIPAREFMLQRLIEVFHDSDVECGFPIVNL